MTGYKKHIEYTLKALVNNKKLFYTWGEKGEIDIPNTAEMTNFTFKMDRQTREAYSALCDALGLTMSSATLALIRQRPYVIKGCAFYYEMKMALLLMKRLS